MGNYGGVMGNYGMSFLVLLIVVFCRRMAPWFHRHVRLFTMFFMCDSPTYTRPSGNTFPRGTWQSK